MRVSLVPGFWLFSYISWASDYGVSAEDLFEAAGLGAFTNFVEDDLVHVDQIDRIMSVLPELTGDPCFYFRIAETPVLERISFLGPLVTTAESYETAVQQINRFGELVHPFVIIELRSDSLFRTVVYSPANHTGMKPHYCEMFIGSILTFFRLISNSEISPVRVSFQFSKPLHHDCYTTFFNAPVDFDADETAIQFYAKDLMNPLPGANQMLNQWAVKKAENALRMIPRASMADQIRIWLLEYDKPLLASLQTAARHFSQSERTLQRQLRSCGVTFSELKNRVLYLKARDGLAQHGKSIPEIADDIGFSDATAFHKAFKRWSGVTIARHKKTVC